MINASWLTPTLFLTFGFPLLMVGLGEIAGVGTHYAECQVGQAFELVDL